jgi:hypothetical protein
MIVNQPNQNRLLEHAGWNTPAGLAATLIYA